MKRPRREPPFTRRSAATVALLAALALCGTALAQDEPERVGSETCEGCHDEVVAGFRDSVHWNADPEGSCENCHGAGSVHAEEMDPALIRLFVAETAADERSAACASCHGRNAEHANFRRSDHALGSVACNDCHRIHPAAEGTQPKGPPDLCYTCHADIQAQFSLNERHPVRQGGMNCMDCHDVHRATRRARLGGFKQELCLSCHTDYRGPWVFEHEASTVEGCLSCHTPHGSPNRHLLTYQRAGDLCLQCHAEQPFFHDLTETVPGQPPPTTRQFRSTAFNDCTRCHSEIHGSNNDALFLN
jgi:DmsE family decaheme c-type cytochrome